MGLQEATVFAVILIVFCGREVAALGVLSSACTIDADCGPGLYCFACDGAPSVCIADQATPVSSFAQNYSLPFNKYSWITTHNAYAIRGELSILGSVIISPTNQEDTVTSQLNNGVRGLMLDVYEFDGDIWLCHSDGICYDFTAFRPLNGTLTEIETFLALNPNEVVTIFFEDYVTIPNALSNAFTAAGLTKYLFPLANMPKTGGDWPTVASMIASNQRLLVFTSDKTKEASEGIAYQWNYVVENQYGSLAQACPNRAESAVLNDTTKSLFLENYFPNDPDATTACIDNSDSLIKALTVCRTAAGRWANFLAIDFYKRSTSRGVFKAIDTLNGELHCGCDDVHACQANNAQGVCTIMTASVVAAPTSPKAASVNSSALAMSPSQTTSATPKSSPGPEQLSSCAHLQSSRVLSFLALLIAFFLLK